MRVRLETIRDAIVTIADYCDAKVILAQAVLIIFCPKAIVVVEDAAQGGLQLLLILIIHRYADAHGRCAITLATPPTDVRQVALGELDLARLSVLAETSSTHFRIELRSRQDQCFIRRV